MGPEKSRKPRPYWHVDAKWVTGLVLIFVLSAALLVHALTRITAERQAVDAVSTALAIAFSPKGLDEPTDLALLRERLKASPGGLQPIPGLRITIRA